jgi:hypothetical protein
MECKYTKLLHQNVILGAQFDVMCHKVEWTKLVGLMEVVFHLYKYTPNKYLFFLVCPNLYVQNGPNPIRMKFPFIFHPKKRFHSEIYHIKKNPPTRNFIFHLQKFPVKALLESTPKWVLAKALQFNVYLIWNNFN